MPETACYPVIMQVPDALKALSGREKLAALSRLARESAGLSAEKSGVRIDAFTKTPSGMPEPSNGVFWSISHKSDVVAGVVAKSRIGIDIEMIRPVRQQLYDRILTSEESRLFGNDDSETVFFRAFTAKEAVLKHTGDGIKGLSKAEIAAVTDKKNVCVTYLNQKYFVENFFGDGYLASVTKQSRDVQWTVV